LSATPLEESLLLPHAASRSASNAAQATMAARRRGTIVNGSGGFVNTA
jgi:hypothetical protein